MSDLKKDGVEGTLCISLRSRAIAVKKLPQILPDHDAVRILKEMGGTKTIKYANDYIKKAGNNDAELHFSADNGQSVADKCGMKLVEERPFFCDARKQLKKKLKLYTRIAMKFVDEGGRRVFLTYLKG